MSVVKTYLLENLELEKIENRTFTAFITLLISLIKWNIFLFIYSFIFIHLIIFIHLKGYSFNAGTYQTLILGIANMANDGLSKIRRAIMPEKIPRSLYRPPKRYIPIK